MRISRLFILFATGLIPVGALQADEKLADQAAVAVPPAADTPQANDPDQRVRCRKVAVTGSLVRKEKICKTMAEWREWYREGSRNARDILDAANNGSSNGR